jgi:hypothetical protein
MSTTAAPIAIKNSDDPETARQRHDAAARKSRLGWANVLSHATRLCGAEGTLRERHRGHARPRLVTRLPPIPSSCAAFVPGASRPCPRFPPCRSMVRRGVDGSSPSEGSAKAQHTGLFRFGSICRSSNVGQVWSPLWSLQVENARGGAVVAAASRGVLCAFASGRSCKATRLSW